MLKIAIMVHNLKMDIPDGIRFAAEKGCQGVHLACMKGYNPTDMDATARRNFVKFVNGLGMEVSAICAWGGGVDLGKPEDWEKHIEEGKRYLDFAADLECGIWTGHCGIMPHTKDDPKWSRFVDAFGQLGQYGEKVGAKLAIETGPEPPDVLLDMLNDVGSPSVAVNYDPANLIIWAAGRRAYEGIPYNREEAFAEYKPVEGVKVLAEHIVHTHAKDALVHENGRDQEVPLGTGWVDWKQYVKNLKEVGYDGYFAVEREVGDNPVEDISKAVDFLKTL